MALWFKKEAKAVETVSQEVADFEILLKRLWEENLEPYQNAVIQRDANEQLDIVGKVNAAASIIEATAIETNEVFENNRDYLSDEIFEAQTQVSRISSEFSKGVQEIGSKVNSYIQSKGEIYNQVIESEMLERFRKTMDDLKSSELSDNLTKASLGVARLAADTEEYDRKMVNTVIQNVQRACSRDMDNDFYNAVRRYDQWDNETTQAYAASKIETYKQVRDILEDTIKTVDAWKESGNDGLIASMRTSSQLNTLCELRDATQKNINSMTALAEGNVSDVDKEAIQKAHALSALPGENFTIHAKAVIAVTHSTFCDVRDAFNEWKKDNLAVAPLKDDPSFIESSEKKAFSLKEWVTDKYQGLKEAIAERFPKKEQDEGTVQKTEDFCKLVGESREHFSTAQQYLKDAAYMRAFDACMSDPDIYHSNVAKSDAAWEQTKATLKGVSENDAELIRFASARVLTEAGGIPAEREETLDLLKKHMNILSAEVEVKQQLAAEGKTGFDSYQVEEMAKSLAAGGDITAMKSVDIHGEPSFDAFQMSELEKTRAAGYDTSSYEKLDDEGKAIMSAVDMQMARSSQAIEEYMGKDFELEPSAHPDGVAISEIHDFDVNVQEILDIINAENAKEVAEVAHEDWEAEA